MDAQEEAAAKERRGPGPELGRDAIRVEADVLGEGEDGFETQFPLILLDESSSPVEFWTLSLTHFVAQLTS